MGATRSPAQTVSRSRSEMAHKAPLVPLVPLALTAHKVLLVQTAHKALLVPQAQLVTATSSPTSSTA